ncbi:MAG: hypothetical protein KF793_11035, partial [Nitrospira sp.]|nr:hypothetical protein [Nitrospira sp.]
RQIIAELLFTDLREDEWMNRKLPLRMDIDTTNENRPVRKRIPALAVFLNFLIGRNPIESKRLGWY